MELVGMGLMIEYQDRATEGLNRTEEAFNKVRKGAEDLVTGVDNQMGAMENLSAQFMSQIYAGERLVGAGRGVLDFYSDFGSQVIATGDDFEKTRITLEALYKSSEVAEEKMRWAMDYAAKTPFDIQDIKGALVGMKAVGIEVDKQITSVSGYKQEFMSFIGDLSALRPDVGMGRVTYAIRNALGGNIRSLQSALDINVEQILGRKFNGANAQQDIADLVSKMGAEGLMEKLNGTWSQMLSNMGDQATRFWLSISDAGAFDEFKSMLKGISTTISNIDDEEMAKIGKSISSAIVTILKPTKMLINVGTKAFIWVKDLVKDHPILLKVLSVIPAIIGAVLALTGGMLILNGTLGIVKIFMLGLPKMVGNFAKTLGLANVGTVTLTKSLGFILLKFAKIIAISYLLKKAWEIDFLGIKTITTKVFDGLARTSENIFRIMKLDAKEYIEEVQKLFKEENFFSDLSAKALEFIAIVRGISEAWADNTISTETYDLLDGLGLLHVLETVLDLKYRVEEFWGGFKKGAEDTRDEVFKFMDEMAKRFEPLMEFKDKLFGNKEDKTEGLLGNPSEYAKAGEEFAKMASAIVIILSVVKVISIISGIMKILAPLSKFLLGALTSLGLLLGIPAWLAGLVVVSIGIIIALIIEHWESIKEFFIGVGEKIGETWTRIKETVVALIDGLVQSFAPLINGVAQLFGYDGEVIEVGVVEKRSSINGPNAPISYTPPEKFNRQPIGASTGGFTRNEGLLYLHPDELIVNDRLTQMLGNFLVANNNNPNSVGSTSNDLEETSNDIARVPNTVEVHEDNSINIEKGAIEVIMQNGSEEEIDSLADKLWVKIQKKKEVDNARKYKPQQA